MGSIEITEDSILRSKSAPWENEMPGR